MEVCSQGEGPLSVDEDGFLLTLSLFAQLTEHALRLTNFDATGYSRHSFRIGAATAGVPAYFIRMLGRWQSEAYHAYISTPRELLASVSQLMA